MERLYLAEQLLMSLEEASAKDTDTLYSVLISGASTTKADKEKELLDFYNTNNNSTNTKLDAKAVGYLKNLASKKNTEPQDAKEDPNDAEPIEKKDSENTTEPAIPKERFPSYNEFRKKWYAKTVAMGWPNDLMVPVFDKAKSDKGWIGNVADAYIFRPTVKAINMVTLGRMTKNIKTELYQKFGDNIKKLRELKTQVDKIVDAEAQFLKDKNSKGLRGVFNTLTNAIYSGLGFTERDRAIMNFLTRSNESQKMTIFMYQQMVLTEVMSYLEVDEDTAVMLKKTLESIYKTFEHGTSTKKDSKFIGMTLTKIKTTTYMGEYVASFQVLTPTAGETNIVMPYVDSLDFFMNNVNIKSFDEHPDPKKVDDYIQKLKVAGDDKKNAPAKVKKVVESSDVEPRFVKYKMNGKTKLGEYVYEIKYLPRKAEIIISYETEE